MHRQRVSLSEDTLHVFIMGDILRRTLLQYFDTELSDNIHIQIFTVYCIIEEIAEEIYEEFPPQECERKMCDFFNTVSGYDMSPEDMHIENDYERYLHLINCCQSAAAYHFDSEERQERIAHALRQLVNIRAAGG